MSDLPRLPGLGDIVLEVSGDFEPSQRQELFRELADGLTSSDFGAVGDWLTATKGLFVGKDRDGLPVDVRWSGEPVTVSEWRGWLKQEGFEEWFYGGLTMPSEWSERDVASLDRLFFEKIRDGMRAGDMKALSLYADVTGKKRPREETGGVTVQALLVRGGGGDGDAAAAFRAAWGLPSEAPVAVEVRDRPGLMAGGGARRALVQREPDEEDE